MLVVAMAVPAHASEVRLQTELRAWCARAEGATYRDAASVDVSIENADGSAPEGCHLLPVDSAVQAWLEHHATGGSAILERSVLQLELGVTSPLVAQLIETRDAIYDDAVRECIALVPATATSHTCRDPTRFDVDPATPRLEPRAIYQQHHPPWSDRGAAMGAHGSANRVSRRGVIVRTVAGTTGAVNTWRLRSHHLRWAGLALPAAMATSGCFAAEDSGAGYGDESYLDDDAGDDAGVASQGDDAGDEDDDDGDDGDDAAEESGDDEGQDTEGPQACNDADDVKLFLSPDDSNSMSSPVQAREGLLSGWGSVATVAIRPWEFLNYYRFSYPPAEPGTVAVNAAMMIETTDAGDEYVLQIGIASEAMTNDARPPMSLTFVLDTSGSMQGHSLDMLKATCRQIAAKLGEGDTVSMVTWNTENNIVLSSHIVAGPSDATLLAAIDALEADGGTDLHNGLVAGYQLGAASHREGVVSRVLLVTDGGANVGITDEEVIAQHAGDQGSDGIYLVGVGVGDSSTYNDVLLDRVTDVGKGASVFVPTSAEAALVFGERFVSTMAIAARDVQVRLDLPPGFEIVRFSGEEFSTDPALVEPQHLAPDDAMVFHQHLRTCAPEAVVPESPITITVRYQDAVTFEAKEIALETSFAELLAADRDLLLEGAAVFEYATALQATRDSSDASGAVELARTRLEAARAAQPEDADLEEIAAVLAAMQ